MWNDSLNVRIDRHRWWRYIFFHPLHPRKQHCLVRPNIIVLSYHVLLRPRAKDLLNERNNHDFEECVLDTVLHHVRHKKNWPHNGATSNLHKWKQHMICNNRIAKQHLLYGQRRIKPEQHQCWYTAQERWMCQTSNLSVVHEQFLDSRAGQWVERDVPPVLPVVCCRTCGAIFVPCPSNW